MYAFILLLEIARGRYALERPGVWYLLCDSWPYQGTCFYWKWGWSNNLERVRLAPKHHVENKTHIYKFPSTITKSAWVFVGCDKRIVIQATNLTSERQVCTPPCRAYMCYVHVTCYVIREIYSTDFILYNNRSSLNFAFLKHFSRYFFCMCGCGMSQCAMFSPQVRIYVCC